MNYTMEGLTGEEFSGTKDELRAWMSGTEHALYAFGYWKDGLLLVGSSGKTYAEVMREMRKKYKEATGEDYED